MTLSPRALMSLLVNGAKAVDVVTTALETGLLDALEPGPVSRLREVGFCTALLAETGFIDVEVLPGVWELVVARKPG
ncbi:hypothetical protein JCM9534A_63250 [Catenuloplanes indicus JCM 9534]|uniref:Uncharacterized protein n=1 Tax=Catenuloplanes indicus TaxID=137267 RepID=A0AAE3W7C3_9ACTN|nr:hypothetical protein [Catenuloplanes indicus]